MKRILLIFLSITLYTCLNAQDNALLDAVNQHPEIQKIKRCSADEYHQQQMQDDADYRQAYEEMMDFRYETIDAMNSNQSGVDLYCPNGRIFIPIAVHYEAGMGTTAAERACLTDLVYTQMEELNLDFNGQNNPGCTTSPPGGSCITFVLATQSHPNGSGLSNGQPAITFNGAYTCPASSPCNISDWGGYMNVVIQNMLDNGGPLGIAPLNGNPNAGGSANAFIVDRCGFGTNAVNCATAGPNSCTAGWQYVSGRTTTHEIGHYLGLPHTFCGDQGGDPQGATDCNCGFNTDCDGFTDTPNQCHSNYTCFSGICSEPTTSPCDYNPIIYNNFMDYLVDQCMNSFTLQQCVEMNINASVDNYDLSTIEFDNPTCAFRGFYDGAQIYDTQTIDVCSGFEIALKDISENFPTGWNWSFSTSGSISANQSSSNQQEPTVTITGAAGSSGSLTVTFGANNANGSCSGATATYQINILPSGDQACQCALSVIPDYDCIICDDINNNEFADGVSVHLNVYGASGTTVWIEQSNPPNTTFNSGTDINILTEAMFVPFTNTTFNVLQSNGCSTTVTINGADFDCNGIPDGSTPVSLCAAELVADLDNAECNGNTAEIPLSISNLAGNVVFDAASNVQGSGTPVDPYFITAEVGANCETIDIQYSDDQAELFVNSNFEVTQGSANIQGGYTVGTAVDWGVDVNQVDPCVSGNLVIVNDGSGVTSNFCEPTPPATPSATQCSGIAGNIALIDRGLCFFTEKVENAQACGAIAVLICNCELGSADCSSTGDNEVINMSGTPAGPVNIPAVFLSYNDCQEIQVQINQGNTVTACIGASNLNFGCTQTLSVDACSVVCDEAGCTDICADNYNANATSDDGSCLYPDDPVLTGLPSTTSSATPIALNASPPGGTFSGPGVVFNAFNPGIAGPGFHTITYSITDANNCEISASQTVLVVSITYNFVNYNLGTIPPKSVDIEDVDYELYNINGSIIERGKMKSNMNFGHLNDGSYFIRFKIENELISYPFLKY